MKRIPRALGLTSLMKKYHNTRNRDYLSLAIDRAISTYMNEGLTYNGHPRTIEEMATYLHVNEMTLMARIGETSKALFATDKEGTNLIARASTFYTFRKALEASEAAAGQAKMLVEGQKGKYVPFLSSAANQAISNMASNLKPLMELSRLMQPQGPKVAVQINNGQKSSVPAEMAIGVNEAVMLISQQKQAITLLDNPAEKALLAESYIDGQNLPEVVATRQSGNNEMVGNVYTTPKRKKHTERREEDGTIIPLPQ